MGTVITGNRSLYYEVFGTSGPSVVIEVGSTMPGTRDPGWYPIRDALAQEAFVLLYDRANLGQSSTAPMPRSLAVFTDDLRAVLQGSGLTPPFLLIGSSFGGMIVTHYASLYPEDVRGVVVLDAPRPEVNLRVLELLPSERPDEPAALAGFRKLAWQEHYAPLETFEWEGLDVPASIDQAQAAWNLRDIPLVVLTAGINEYDEGFPPEVAADYEALWLDQQKQLAALSSRSEHIVVEDSDHIIHDRKPELVLEVARRLMHSP